MATQGHKVNITYTESELFEYHKEQGTLDPDTIYFVEGEDNSIWVGDVKYSKTHVGIQSVELYYKGPISIGDTDRLLREEIVAANFDIDSIMITGLYINGLKVFNELTCEIGYNRVEGADDRIEIFGDVVSTAAYDDEDTELVASCIFTYEGEI